MKILFFQYPSCSTCKKAAKWLKDHDIDIESKHIVETPPTVGELTEWITRSNLPLQKFFNTSGQKYRERTDRTIGFRWKTNQTSPSRNRLTGLGRIQCRVMARRFAIRDEIISYSKKLGACLFARFKKKYYLCAANANNNQLKNFKWQQKSDYNALVTKTTHFTKL